MATDAERNKAAASERRKRQKDLPRIQRDTAGELGRLLRRAERGLRAQMARGEGSDFTHWLNPQLRQSVRATLATLGTEMGEAMVTGAETAWDAGVALADAPIDAALKLDDPKARIAAHLASVDLRQLGAMREFLTAKMSDVSLQAVNRVNTALGLAATGVRSTGEVVGDVAGILGSSRRRAVTIVRTELGRAYSVAGQERMTQARQRLPGLRKQWRRSGKIHSRIEHDAADGQIQEVDQPFKVGGVELMYPRDPAAPPGETVNCGCQSLPYMESWAESGTLLHPKRRPFTEREIAHRPIRAELNEPAPVRERIGDSPDAPVVVRSADPEPEFAIPRASFPALESAPPEMARTAVRRGVESDDFLAFASGTPRTGERAVAMMSADRRATLGLGESARAVRLSAETVRTHPRFRSLTTEDWLRVQRLVDEGVTATRRTNHRLLWIEDDGRPWMAVVKQTKRDELYLQSYRRAKQSEAAKWSR